MSPERTDFLYPFIEGDERDAGALLADLAASAVAKSAESAALREATLARCGAELDRTADEVAERVGKGGRIFTFGNGGSSTDADALAHLFVSPPWGDPLPARSLASDHAVLTALGNDIGFGLVFVRQLIAYATAGDVAIGLSTSGNSVNVIDAFAEAHRRGLLTVGLAGYDGGAMASSPDLDHCLVVSSASVHRVQEVQDVLGYELWARAQQRLATGATSTV